MPLTEAQKEELANSLHIAWRRYANLFGEPPHGTLTQILALVELTNLDNLVSRIIIENE